jgi:hypothetical protein
MATMLNQKTDFIAAIEEPAAKDVDLILGGAQA